MYYIGLDIHKRTISYCVKDAAGQVRQQGKMGTMRCELDAWIKTLPQLRMMAMEATIFTGWIYDHLLPHAEKVKVAHPLMLRAIATAERKNDKIDAGKIADCLRCDFLPECHMASTEIRDRRRMLRYRQSKHDCSTLIRFSARKCSSRCCPRSCPQEPQFRPYTEVEHPTLRVMFIRSVPLRRLRLARSSGVPRSGGRLLGRAGGSAIRSFLVVSRIRDTSSGTAFVGLAFLASTSSGRNIKPACAQFTHSSLRPVCSLQRNGFDAQTQFAAGGEAQLVLRPRSIQQ